MKTTLLKGKYIEKKFLPILLLSAISIVFSLIIMFTIHPYSLAAENSKETEYQNINLNPIIRDDSKLERTYKLNTLSVLPVQIVFEDSTETFLVNADTVESILHELNLEKYLNDKYYIQTEQHKKLVITSPKKIIISKITFKDTVSNENIPFKKEVKKTDSMYKGQERITQNGKNGIKEITTRQGIVKGKIVSEEIVKTVITKKAISEIKEVGTKERPGRASLYQHPPKTKVVNGEKITYCGTKNVYATSYHKDCLGCNGKGITSTGVKLHKGVIAANVKYIPYYTEFYVPGYGFGEVLDTGALRSNQLDLGYWDFKKDNANWSSRYVDVYVLCD